MSDIFDKIADGGAVGGTQQAGKGVPGGDIFDSISPERTFAGTAKDVGIDVLSGFISVPEAGVGLADIFTGGRVGKGLEGVGFKTAEAKEILKEQYSPARKEAGRKFEEAEGIVDKTIAAIANPSVVASAVLESLPLMGAGGAVARGIPLLGAGGRMLSGVARGAIGEGTVAAGSAAEAVRQQTGNKLLTPGQAALAGTAGALTGAFTQLGGKAAQKLGIADFDTFLAGAGEEAGKTVKKHLARRVVEGFITEGFFEELPQSVQEQIIQNISLDRPPYEGVDDAAVLGALSGGVMGAGFNLVSKGGKGGTGVPLPAPELDTTPKGAVGRAAAAGGLDLRTPAFIPDERRGEFAKKESEKALNLRGFEERKTGAPSTAAESAEAIAGAGGVTLSEMERVNLAEKQAVDARQKELEQTMSTLPTEVQEKAAKAAAMELAESDPIHELRRAIKKGGRLNYETLIKQYDKDTVSALMNKAPGIVSRKGKVNLDELADEMNYIFDKNDDQILHLLAESESRSGAVSRIEKEQAAAAYDNRFNEEADELESKGFEPVFAEKPAIDLNKGDKIITEATDDLPADEYVVKGKTEDGKVILEDGVRVEVGSFDLVNVKGVKRSGQDGLGVPVAAGEKVEAEPSAAAPSPGVPGIPSPAPAAAEGEAVVKEPWQMSKKDYLVAGKTGKKYQSDKFLSGKHSESVRIAIEKGLAVPEEVLKDYPDLAPEETPLSTETIDNTKSIAHGHDVNTSPSDAMKEAENYKKAHVLVDGLEISVENPVGSTRSGVDDDGNEWSQVMRSDYGYFKGSVGFDKDHVDVFLKPSYKGGKDTVHIVNQKNSDGSFDEHKVVLGASSVKDALLIYNSNYEKGWDGAKNVVEMPLEDFQKWVKSKAPAKGEVKQRKFDKEGKRVDRRKDSPFRKKVSEMTRAELEERMLKDKLTGLDNERGFWERFVEGNHRYVLRADMDNLHDLNDILGYSGSDQLIKEIAAKSKELGFYFAREKGDEFLSSEDDFEGLDKIAGKLQSLLDNTIIRVTAENGKVYEKKGIGISYGIEESLGKAEAQQKLAKERSLAEGRRIQGRQPGISAADLGLVEITPEGRKPEGSEAGDTVSGVKPVKVEVGGKMGADEVVLTVTGRETTPFPSNLDTSTSRKATNTLKRIDAWLMDNAIAEAESRGDDFNLRQFEANRDKPTTADKDSAEVYLFDPASAEIPIPEPILKDLAPEKKPETEAAPEPEPTEEKPTGPEEDTSLDAFVENSLPQLNDIDVELKATREETGETVVFTEKAGDALKDVNARLQSYNKMIDCVGV